MQLNRENRPGCPPPSRGFHGYLHGPTSYPLTQAAFLLLTSEDRMTLCGGAVLCAVGV